MTEPEHPFVDPALSERIDRLESPTEATGDAGGELEAEEPSDADPDELSTPQPAPDNDHDDG